MDSNNPISVFVVLVTLYVFSLTLAILALGNWSVLFTLLAFAGLIIGLSVSLTLGITLQKEGVSMALFYFIFTGLNQVTLIWFFTRFGHHLGFL